MGEQRYSDSTETSSVGTDERTIIPPDINIQLRLMRDKSSETQRGLEANLTANTDVLNEFSNIKKTLTAHKTHMDANTSAVTSVWMNTEKMEHDLRQYLMGKINLQQNIDSSLADINKKNKTLDDCYTNQDFLLNTIISKLNGDTLTAPQVTQASKRTKNELGAPPNNP